MCSTFRSAHEPPLYDTDCFVFLESLIVSCALVNYYTYSSSLNIENITWLRGNMKFISSVEQDISRVSAANEDKLITV